MQIRRLKQNSAKKQIKKVGFEFAFKNMNSALRSLGRQFHRQRP